MSSFGLVSLVSLTSDGGYFRVSGLRPDVRPGRNLLTSWSVMPSDATHHHFYNQQSGFSLGIKAGTCNGCHSVGSPDVETSSHGATVQTRVADNATSFHYLGARRT